MKRVSVSLPDDLAKRMEPYKDQINVSRLAAQAIEREIQRLEAVPALARELDDLLVRLRQQADTENDELWRVAFEDGIRYAQSADLADLRQWEYIQKNGFTTEIYHLLPASSQALVTELQQAVDEGRHKTIVHTYVQAWMNGVMYVWQGVKNKL